MLHRMLALAALLLMLPLPAAAQDNDVSLFLGGAGFEKTTIVAFLPEDLVAVLA